MRDRDGLENHPVVDLRIPGDSQDLRMTPILVEDRGGDLDAGVVERLVRAYREEGSAHRVVAGQAATH